MAKYLQFQVRPVGTNPAQFVLVNMDEVKMLWYENDMKIVFVGNNFTTEGEVCYLLSQPDAQGEVYTYLQREWASLINSNDSIRIIPAQLPLVVTEDCEDNTWQEWVVQAGFEPTIDGVNCNVILSATIEPEGLGTITIGEQFINPVTGAIAWLATATGTPCGTQEIAFLQESPEFPCGEEEQPVPGMEEYNYTGAIVACENEGGEPVLYCLIAKPVKRTTPVQGQLQMKKVTVTA